MASVKIILRKDKINKNTGLAPLYIRIIKDRKSKFISLGIKVEPKYWNEEKMSIKKGATNYQELNNFIIQKRAEAEKASIEIEINGGATTKKIKDQIVGRKPKNFFTYADKKILELKYSLSPSTYSTYKCYVDKLAKYKGSRDLSFNEIDINFVKDYENHLYKIGNKAATVEYTFRVVKIMFNHAINEGVIGSEKYPFKNYRFKVPKPIKNYLNEEQFKAVLDYKERPFANSDIYYDMFIFVSYAGGLRFFDVLELKWNNYIEQESRIVKVIRKSKRKHQFKLPKKAIEIIEKYKNPNDNQTDYIFPLLRNNYDYTIAPEIIYTEKNKWGRKVNKLLIRIGEDVELPFKLTFHTSRHTFATRALNKGMRIEHVSKILDHTDISITQVYAKIINKELDKAMDIMDD